MYKIEDYVVLPPLILCLVSPQVSAFLMDQFGRCFEETLLEVETYDSCMHHKVLVVVVVVVEEEVVAAGVIVVGGVAGAGAGAAVIVIAIVIVIVIVIVCSTLCVGAESYHTWGNGHQESAWCSHVSFKS